ncbi:MAG: bifunctional ornithine acetyltransferase/N-acetylglutamate synthase [Chloroflexi bacterium RBG_13_50_10]|nr:MAG: bifunctional ornithine acetyltransferase/N-acetylglutamate synthase [Chloroflexi bacterium RBG_13_50_10]
MGAELKAITSGTVTSPQGFQAGAVEASIKSPDKLDLAILLSEKPCVAAGVFTTTAIKSAPVILSRKHLKNNNAQAVVVNSGCANACTGDPGMADAVEMAKLVSEKLGVSAKDVLVASTGVIGVPLPMEQVRAGIRRIVLTKDGGHKLARAIMTTDTLAKEMAISVESGLGGFTIGGVAKGAGMIHPNMATLLCFLTTDAAVEASFLQSALQKAVDASFNMVTIDGDTSPSDTVVILANGLARTQTVNKGNGEVFQKALTEVCLYLAKCVARDGEGATKLIEVVVEGALNEAQARLAARTIASSPLFKAAIHGNDPNWGRVVAALGRSGAKVNEKKLDIYLNDVCVMKQGSPAPFDKQELSKSMAGKEVSVRLCLNLGQAKAVAWGCDLSEEYVTINSAYTT